MTAMARRHEAMIWTPDGGTHAVTYGALRAALGIEPVLHPEFRHGTAPADGDSLCAVDFEATATAAGCAFGWLPVNAVWKGEAAFALPGSRLPNAALGQTG